MAAWGLPPDLLSQTSPFHLVLGPDLVVLQAGPSLRRHCPQLAPGARLSDHMELLSPRGALTVEVVCAQARSVYVLKLRDGDLKLRGQMLHDPHHGVLVFIGSPWITDLATVEDMGMTLDDFGVADNLVDYLLLLQTQGTALTQARRLAEDLQRSTAELEGQARQLERLSRQLESVLDSAGEGICGLDATGTITFANSAAARLLGTSREELVGRDMSTVVPTHPHAADLASGLAEAATTAHGAGRHLREDGSSFHYESLTAPVLEGGRVVGSVIVIRDVSERRAMDRLKDEFVSMVSHELRTPLTSVRGALGLLSAGVVADLPPRAARLLEVANLSSERLMRLINDILDVERMAAGKLALDLRRTRAGDVLHVAADEMAGFGESAGVRILVDDGTGELDGEVWADPDRLVQTLSNLLGNAVKFSDKGSSVRLRATGVRDHVRFDVSDSGDGIPPEQIGTIFEKFRQGDASDSRHKNGTGLGLAICQGLVEAHGGRIWVTSKVGEGTTVSFTIPRTPGEVCGGGRNGRSVSAEQAGSQGTA